MSNVKVNEDPEAVGDRFERVRSAAAQNPLGLALGSIAVGILIGLALPVSDIERERVGPIGEKVIDSAKAAAEDAIEQGKSAVAQALGA